MKKINKITVVGAGTMGAGIAQVCIENGCQVVLCDIKDDFVEKGFNTIKSFLGRKVEKGKLDKAGFDEIIDRISLSTDLAEAVMGSDLVVEAVFEDLALKQKIFKDLDQFSAPDTILASNTSTLSITEIASATKRPERVVGTHFFSPVPVMKLVEVIKGNETKDEIVKATLSFCETFGKTPILAKDVPGFIVNRFLCLLYNEAANQILNGYATPKDIDLGMKLGANHPMGIAELMDMAGVDVVYNALEALYEMTNEDRYKPSPLFVDMINANKLGRKTGEGFYKY
jgi:3-hydroxybutyryl-CoA dehydrogenase